MVADWDTNICFVFQVANQTGGSSLASAGIGAIIPQQPVSDSVAASQGLLPKPAVDLLAQTIHQEIGLLQDDELVPVRVEIRVVIVFM